MQSARKAIVAAAAAAALQGCAGSGGGDNGVIGETFPELLLCAPLGICGAPKNLIKPRGPTVAAPVEAPPVTFTRWSDHLGQISHVQATGPQTVTDYEFGTDGSVQPTTGPTFSANGTTVLRYDHDAYVQKFTTQGVTLHYGKDFAGHPEIEVAGNNENYERSIGLVANPYDLGWDYQSFGVWNALGVSGVARKFGAISFGATTPAHAVPTAGTATFTGKLGGQYVSPTGQGSLAAADLTVNANFSARSLSFASTGTTARDVEWFPGRTPATKAAPHLNLNGTLTYSPGANAFNGTLTNAGGTMSGTSNGQFYGPAAQELGGVFTLKSPTTVETFAGAYGAKR